ncbi:arsenate reductase family protein [Nocardioides sp. B-3]|uniref:arsenate reductase family protein n=1 Tax=Nocardioides sp. B-3 TaxID=2895565 RepID=UPI00215234C8|nr:ArsC/Spx/MgsR family protein [Nocardioides sp. B-3]UUZ59668.1 hypothetical protein LP418_00485 [Nocardioides sp. B-3]
MSYGDQRARCGWCRLHGAPLPRGHAHRRGARHRGRAAGRRAVARRADKEAREAGIDLPRDAEHRADWLAALAANPKAIQRPIITATDGTTVIGRDADSLRAVIDAESH